MSTKGRNRITFTCPKIVFIPLCIIIGALIMFTFVSFTRYGIAIASVRMGTQLVVGQVDSADKLVEYQNMFDENGIQYELKETIESDGTKSYGIYTDYKNTEKAMEVMNPGYSDTVQGEGGFS